MDKKTTKVLGRISRNVPKHLQNNIVKTVVDDSEEQIARDALRSPHISADKKKVIAQSLERGDFRRAEQVENDEVIAQIDEYNDKAVKAAIASGEIPPPTEDAFIQKRNQKGKGVIQIKGNIRPLKNKVLIRPDVEPKQQVHASGIIMPESQKKRSMTGCVLAIGKEVTSVCMTMRVAFQDYNYETVESNGESLYIMGEDNIIAYFI